MTKLRKPSVPGEVPQIGRRDALLAGLGTSVGAGLSMAAPHSVRATETSSSRGIVPADGAVSQTATLQQALNDAAVSGNPLFLPAGTYKTDTLTLEPGTHVQGVPGRTILKAGGSPILTASGAENVRLSGLVLDGGGVPLDDDGALMTATDVTDLDVSACRFVNSGAGGMTLRKSSGRIANCTLGNIGGAALFSEDASGLEISNNHIHDCGDNGILVWRSEQGEDGTLVSGNRILQSHLDDVAPFGIHRRLPQLVRVHLPKAFVALYRRLLPGRAQALQNPVSLSVAECILDILAVGDFV